MDYERARYRFMWFVEKEPSGCWKWKGGLKTDVVQLNGRHKQYGQFKMGKNMRAHRASYLLFRGEIPEGMFVLHDCDNSLCMNPEHLKLGTHQDNMDDMVRRGRSSPGGSRGRTKLTVDQVRSIQTDPRSTGTLAKIYGVCSENIRLIKKRATWKDLQ